MPQKSFLKTRRAIKRFLFRIRTRPIIRDRDQIGLPRIIQKTPRVKGTRLALKSLNPIELERERAARKGIIELHKKIGSMVYNLFLSKRYPSIRNKRTEIYYDKPSLADLMEKRKNRRVKKFLAQHNLNLETAHKMAIAVYEELKKNISPLQPNLHIDLAPDQFLVDSVNEYRQMNLIMVDI